MIKQLYKKSISEKSRLEIATALKKIKSLFMAGNNFKCNLCNHGFRSFLSKGNGIVLRTNAECPFCSSLERTRLLYFYLQNETSIFNQNPTVLHVSPESALKKKFLSNPNYIDIDLNPNLASYQEDLTKLSFSNGKFDYIICSHVLGHIPDEEKAVSELLRVLNANGQAFILSLINLKNPHTLENPSFKTEEERLQNYGQKDLVRLHGSDFSQRLQKAGFKVEMIDYRTHFSPQENNYYSLGDGQRELIFKCTKN